MADLPIKLSLIAGGLTRPVLEGRAPVAGAEVEAQTARSVNANSMDMLELKHDVAEMSLATFTKAREQGIGLIALPLFTGRRFLQGATTVAASSGLKDPSQLRGKRLGQPQFWQTSSVWHRLILRQVYGISPDDASWVTNAPERMGALSLPPNARLDPRDQRELLVNGEIDAIMGAGAGGPQAQGGTDDRVVRLQRDVPAAARAYYEQTGVFPIMHMIVMREELAERDPWLVESVCSAFHQAKEIMREAPAESQDRPIPGLSPSENSALFGDDPYRYGVEPNRKVLETFLVDVHTQGLIDRPMVPEDLFAKNLPTEYR